MIFYIIDSSIVLNFPFRNMSTDKIQKIERDPLIPSSYSILKEQK